jgi:hypothetical protein
VDVFVICVWCSSAAVANRWSAENFGGPWRNLDIICNFYVYYTVSLYSDSSSCHRRRIADNFRLITLHQIRVPRTTTIATVDPPTVRLANASTHLVLIKWNFYDHYFIDVCTFFKKN